MKSAQSSSVNAIVLLLICVFCWGSVFPLAKFVLHDMNELSLALWRFVIAAGLLTLVMLVQRQPLPGISIKRLSIIVVVSIIGIGGFNLALFSGIQHTAATNGALIMALSPMLTSLLSAIIARKWLTKSQSFSLLMGFSGVLLVITNGSLQRLLAFEFNQGDMMIMFGMLTWSFYTLCSQRMSQWMPLLPLTFTGMLSGALTVGIMCLFAPGMQPLTELENASQPLLLAVLYIGVFGTVVAYMLWSVGVKSLGPAKASLFFNLVPVSAALTSVFMGQSLTLIQISGMFIVVLGLMLPAALTMRSAKVVLA